MPLDAWNDWLFETHQIIDLSVGKSILASAVADVHREQKKKTHLTFCGWWYSMSNKCNFHTAFATTDLVDAALEGGAKRVFHKDVDRTELIDGLKEILNSELS